MTLKREKENRFLTVTRAEAINKYYEVTNFEKPTSLPESLRLEEINSLGIALKSGIAELPGLFPERRASRTEYEFLQALGARAVAAGDSVTASSVLEYGDEYLSKTRSFILRITLGSENRKNLTLKLDFDN
jgi:hypothetical protein